MRYRHLFLIIILFATQLSNVEANQSFNIGVRAHNGKVMAEQRWQATADHLTSTIENTQFHIIPVEKIGTMEELVKNHQLDFVITQPVAYVDLEVLYGASRLLTLVNVEGQKKFSSIIFTRHDNKNIFTFNDLKDRTFAAVTPKGLGGWLMAKYKLEINDVKESDFSSLHFLNFQGSVVDAVLNKRVEAGTVRTGILEMMEKKGLINKADFRILNKTETEGFPYSYSTDLYPEWALAKTSQASIEMAEKVTQSLLYLNSSSAAAIKGNYEGWTVSVNYQTVHHLMKELHIGPYKKLDINDVIDNYYPYIVGAFVCLILMLIVIIKFIFNMYEKNKLIREISNIATFDTLTKVPNRRVIYELINVAIQRARRDHELIAILFIDLDKFKHINDTYGHSVGDEMLKAVVKAVKINIRSSDIIGRFGGDEFIVCLNNVGTENDGKKIVNVILQKISEIKILGHEEIQASVSIGMIMQYANATTQIENLIEEADRQMYKAKRLGGATYSAMTIAPSDNVVQLHE